MNKQIEFWWPTETLCNEKGEMRTPWDDPCDPVVVMLKDHLDIVVEKDKEIESLKEELGRKNKIKPDMNRDYYIARELIADVVGTAFVLGNYEYTPSIPECIQKLISVLKDKEQDELFDWAALAKLRKLPCDY